MKYTYTAVRGTARVTPHAGVRIEIEYRIPKKSLYQSPPTRGCELKFIRSARRGTGVVTPHAGVRIEIVSERAC